MEAADRWNARYSQGFEPFPDRPAEWLVAHGALLPGGGHALDVACGDGRNAAYLARLGYEVEAIDASDVAIDALRAAAGRRGLAVTARVVDLERAPLPAGPYDVIVTMNFLQRELFGPLQAALAPGGLLVYETLGTSHVEQLGRSFDRAYLLERGELLQAFGALEVLAHHEGVAQRSDGARGVESIVARRPRDAQRAPGA